MTYDGAMPSYLIDPQGNVIWRRSHQQDILNMILNERDDAGIRKYAGCTCLTTHHEKVCSLEHHREMMEDEKREERERNPYLNGGRNGR